VKFLLNFERDQLSVNVYVLMPNPFGKVKQRKIGGAWFGLIRIPFKVNGYVDHVSPSSQQASAKADQSGFSTL
jgi:hypothetical protein